MQVSILNFHFGNIVNSFNLSRWPSCFNFLSNRLERIIEKYKNHPSIIKIKQNYSHQEKFVFQTISAEKVSKIIKELPTDKISSGEIPLKILKNADFTFKKITDCINESIVNNTFPNCLKLATMTPLYKYVLITDLLLFSHYFPKYLRK